MNIKTQAVSLYFPSWFETQCFREYPFQNFNTGFWWNSIQTYSRVDQSVCGKQNRSIRSMSEKAMLSHEAGIWNFHYKIGSIRNLGDEAGGCSSVYLVKFRGTGLFISKVSDEAWGFSFYGIRKSDQMRLALQWIFEPDYDFEIWKRNSKQDWHFSQIKMLG